jgi:uncharacterized protein
MVSAPRSDADIPRFCAELGIPGLVDVHTHFMPDRVLAKVWAYFDRMVDERGAPLWPITYRGDEAERISTLERIGVRRYTSMLYPHKPDMAEWLNAWADTFAAANPRCARTLTFYPEPEADRYVSDALDRGAEIAKVHLQVGGFDPRDHLLDPVWRRLALRGVPIVIHAGSGPQPGAFTGPGPIADVLERHPDLVLIFAHMGGPEYTEFVELALRHPCTHLDTTMAFTDFMEALSPFPEELVQTLADHPDRIVLGSDFPNIPHAYAHQIEALVRLGLGDDWLRAVCHDNGARLIGAGPGPAAPGTSGR